MLTLCLPNAVKLTVHHRAVSTPMRVLMDVNGIPHEISLVPLSQEDCERLEQESQPPFFVVCE